MIEAKFTLAASPFSINRWSGGSKRFISADAKDWIQDIKHAAGGPQTQSQIALIRDSFKPKKHSIGIALTFHIPASTFYNKQGLFSSKTCDVTNIEKPLIDILFLAKYSGSNYRSIEHDDKYISELSSKKVAADSHKIEVRIWLIDRV